MVRSPSSPTKAFGRFKKSLEAFICVIHLSLSRPILAISESPNRNPHRSCVVIANHHRTVSSPTRRSLVHRSQHLSRSLSYIVQLEFLHPLIFLVYLSIPLFHYSLSVLGFVVGRSFSCLSFSSLLSSLLSLLILRHIFVLSLSYPCSVPLSSFWTFRSCCPLPS